MRIGTTAAVIMVGPGGDSPLEQLVVKAQRAAALDLIDLLDEEDIAPIIVAAPALSHHSQENGAGASSWLPKRANVIRDDDPPGAPFHFGRRLADIVTRYGLDQVFYFGGASGPLLQGEMVRVLRRLLDMKRHSPVALTNNRHSSDWVGFTQAQSARGVLAEVDRDNSLAWLLEQEADYDVRVLAALHPSASMDIDTPTDLAVLALHPQTRPHLAGVLQSDIAAPLRRIPLAEVLDIAATSEKQLAIIGRVAPLAWQAFSKATRIWIRVFSEERGMVASGRAARGEARSLLGLMVDRGGPEAFFTDLASLADAAIIDSRVLMSHRGLWPGAAERFASDGFEVGAVQDEWLRAFTRAAVEAPIPVVLGGHGLVSGGLYALAEILAIRRKV
ncbi:MAG: hypothetical protein JXB47_09265 [Anaerolineae bacterium]|nr:hypothetical protein [Anaerolineae bacterium]